MWMKFCILGMALWLPAQMASGQSAELELAKAGKTPYTIVHGKDCIPSELYAVQELAGYLQQMTGAVFPVVDETRAPARRRIVVGPCNLSRRLLGKKTVDGLGGEEFVIRTQGKDLVLVGGRPRGTLYAAYHFLDNILGVRWWARDAVSVPRKAELKIEALDITPRPAFELRQLHFASAWEQDWSAHNRLNRLDYATRIPDVQGSTVQFALDEKHGGGISFPMPGQKACHTFYAYLPVDKYFDAHPDWFAEIDGKRTRNGQPCLTNPEVLAVVTEEVLKDMRENPKINMVHVSQYDGDQNQCRCAGCRKVDEEENSPAGSLLRFVNAVAGRVEKERPDVLVETFAYCHTQKPPGRTRPRANVVIQLCFYGGANRFHPLDAPDNSNGWLKTLQGWAAISSHVHIWDYMLRSLRPYPNLRVMGPDLRVLAKNGATGIFIQGDDGYPPGAEFDELRTWVLSRLLWNPNQDDQALIAEFVNGYYGAAGRYVLDYINLVHDAAARGNCQLYLGGEQQPSPFVTFEVMSRAEELFRQAEQAVAGDPALLGRVRRAHMSVQYLWAVNRDLWAEEAKAKGLPSPPPAGDFYEALRKQALIEIAREAAMPLDRSAAVAARTPEQAIVGLERDGVGKLAQRRMEACLVSVKKEMDLSPLKFSVKASGSYASQPFHVFDGDENTGWNAGSFGPAWIQRNLGKSVKIKAIRTFFGGDAYFHFTYQIEASQDGQTWTAMIPRKTSGCRSEDRPEAGTMARFVRTTIFNSRSLERDEWVGMTEQQIESE